MSATHVVSLKRGKCTPDLTAIARKNLARVRGEIYLDSTRAAFERGDMPNTRSLCEEGIELTAGPFHLCVRDQLQELYEKAKELPCSV